MEKKIFVIEVEADSQKGIEKGFDEAVDRIRHGYVKTVCDTPGFKMKLAVDEQEA